jgi:ABC-type sugar transport system permease subunit
MEEAQRAQFTCSSHLVGMLKGWEHQQDKTKQWKFLLSSERLIATSGHARNAKSFDLIYVLTANGSTTISMSGFVRREMVEYGNMGYGSAASTSLFLIILLTAIIFLKLARVKLSEDAK